MFPLNRMLKAFIKRGELTVFDAAGGRHVFAGPTMTGPGGEALKPVAMRIHDTALYRKLVFNPELHMGEAYMDGTVTFEDGSSIRDFWCCFGQPLFAGGAQKQRWLFRAKMLWRKVQQSNRGPGAEQSPTITTSATDSITVPGQEPALFLAYFRSEDDSLEEAQPNKLLLIAAKMDLKPGQRVLTSAAAGATWRFILAQLEEVEVLGVTLSKEQQELAANAPGNGSGRPGALELKDYRDVEGPFDRIVSIGMFEHVGVHHYNEFFSTRKR